MKICVDSCSEGQFSVVNYTKYGQPFTNMLTIIPFSLDGYDQYSHYIGLQTNLGLPQAVFQTSWDPAKFDRIFKYNQASMPVFYQSPVIDPYPRMNSSLLLMPMRESDSFTRLSLGDSPDNESNLLMSPFEPSFLHLEKKLSSPTSTELPKLQTESKLENLRLEYACDNPSSIVFILSLRGIVLYASPKGLRSILEFVPTDIVGFNLGNIIHPADFIYFLRELRESENSVNIMCRMRKNSSGYTFIKLFGHVNRKKRVHCFILLAKETHLSDIIIPKSVYSDSPQCWLKTSKELLVLDTSESFKDYFKIDPAGSRISDFLTPEEWKLVSSDLLCPNTVILFAKKVDIRFFNTTDSKSGTMLLQIISHSTQIVLDHQATLETTIYRDFDSPKTWSISSESKRLQKSNTKMIRSLL